MGAGTGAGAGTAGTEGGGVSHNMTYKTRYNTERHYYSNY